MAHTTTGGPKGLGQITDSASTVGDMNWIIGLIADVGNTRSGTTADRDALGGGKLYQGLLFINTTTGSIEQYDTTAGWRVLLRPKTNWTPNLTGLTLGTDGSVTGRYAIVGGVCEFWVSIVLGTGAAATGTIYVSTPLSADVAFKDVGTFLALGSNGARVQGVCGLDTAGRFWLLNTANNFLSNAQPWSWQGGHEIRIHGSMVLG